MEKIVIETNKYFEYLNTWESSSEDPFRWKPIENKESTVSLLLYY